MWNWKGLPLETMSREAFSLSWCAIGGTSQMPTQNVYRIGKTEGVRCLHAFSEIQPPIGRTTQSNIAHNYLYATMMDANSLEIQAGKMRRLG